MPWCKDVKRPSVHARWPALEQASERKGPNASGPASFERWRRRGPPGRDVRRAPRIRLAPAGRCSRDLDATVPARSASPRIRSDFLETTARGSREGSFRWPRRQSATRGTPSVARWFAIGLRSDRTMYDIYAVFNNAPRKVDGGRRPSSTCDSGARPERDYHTLWRNTTTVAASETRGGGRIPEPRTSGAGPHQGSRATSRATEPAGPRPDRRRSRFAPERLRSNVLDATPGGRIRPPFAMLC